MSRRYATRQLLRSAGPQRHTLEDEVESGAHIETPARDFDGSIHLLAVFGGAPRRFFIDGLEVGGPHRLSSHVFARRDCDVFHRDVWSEHPDFVGVCGSRNDFVGVDALKSELVWGTSRRITQCNPLPSLL